MSEYTQRDGAGTFISEQSKLDSSFSIAHGCLSDVVMSTDDL